MTKDARIGLIATDDGSGATLLLQRLADTRVVIRVSHRHAQLASVRLAATRGLDLLARLFDNSIVEVDDGSTPAWLSDANGRAASIRDTGQPTVAQSVVVGIGDVAADVYVGVRGWSVFVSRAGAQPVAEGVVGGLVAGAIIAAEAFKTAFRPMLRTAVFRDYCFNALTYSNDASIDAPLSDFPIDAVLVGAGSIGFGFVDALCYLPVAVRGTLALIDNGVIEAKNVFKYASLQTAEARLAKPKVNVLAGWLSIAHPGLVVDPRPALARDAMDVAAAIAVIAPDNLPARRNGQELLTKDVINAAISGTSVDLASLRFGETPCVFCYYRDSPDEAEDYPKIAAMTGLSVEAVTRAYVENRGLTPEDLATISGMPRFAGVPLDEFLGQPLRSLMQRPLYSEVKVTMPGEKPVPVTTAFVSAFAGTLALVETIKLATGLERYRLRNHVGWNLLGVFKSNFVIADTRPPGCSVCGGGPWLDFFRERWAS